MYSFISFGKLNEVAKIVVVSKEYWMNLLINTDVFSYFMFRNNVYTSILNMQI